MERVQQPANTDVFPAGEKRQQEICLHSQAYKYTVVISNFSNPLLKPCDNLSKKTFSLLLLSPVSSAC